MCNKSKNEGLAGFDAETELRRDKKTVEPEQHVEGRTIKIIKDPGQPTQAQIDEHDLTHCPFRAWCSHCARGQAPEDPHRRNKDGDEEGEGEAPTDMARHPWDGKPLPTDAEEAPEEEAAEATAEEAPEEEEAPEAQGEICSS